MNELERIKAMKSKLKARAERMTGAAIGKPFAVRVGRNEINRGTITKVEVVEPVFTGRSVCARFRVHFAMGSLNFEPVIVSRLPF